jgi:hypothetical protein
MGRPPYPPLMLQRWYGLSDEALFEAVGRSLDARATG